MNKLFLFMKSMPRMKWDDASQKKAFLNVIKFFAIMLLLTLAARGVSGAGMAKVRLTSPRNATIEQAISATGQITMANEISINTPVGLTISKLLCSDGEQVEDNQPLIAFSKEETDAAIRLLYAEINKLKIQYKALTTLNAADNNALASAENTLAFAKSDREAAINKSAVSIKNLTTERDEAARLLADLQAQAQPDLDAINLAKVALENAEKSLADGIANKQDVAYSADKAVSQAEAALSSALNTYNKATQQAQMQNEASAADAALLKITMDTKSEQLKEFETIQKNEYRLLSKHSGRIKEWIVEQGQVSSDCAGKISDESEGFILAFFVSSDEALLLGTNSIINIQQNRNVGKAKIVAVEKPDISDKCIITANIDNGTWQQANCEVNIILSSNDYSLCIPTTAIHFDSEGAFIFLLQEDNTILGLQNVVIRENISIQEQSNGLAAITGIISQKSPVIVYSDKAIKAKDRVRVAE